MPRPPRIHYPGAIHHVMARGNNQGDIFFDAQDYLKYLLICKDYLSSMPVFVLAYALMNNHLHLLIEVGDMPISTFMQLVQQRYTQYFNLKYDTYGHVFQGRFKALLVHKEKYLIKLIHYIHNNPLKAGLESTLGIYPWTGHFELVNKRSIILDEGKMLSYFDDSDNEIALQKYLNFMSEADIIDENFYIDHKNFVYNKNNHNKVVKMSAPELLTIVAKTFCVPEDQILSNNRQQNIVCARQVFVYLARRQLKLSGKEVAMLLDMSQEHVAKIYQKILRGNDGMLNERIKCIEKLVQ